MRNSIKKNKWISKNRLNIMNLKKFLEIREIWEAGKTL